MEGACSFQEVQDDAWARKEIAPTHLSPAALRLSPAFASRPTPVILPLHDYIK